MFSIIDWFASKISMLVFVAIALSLLLGFLSMQLNAFDFERRARAAEDVAQLINTVPTNGTVFYEMPVDKYVLKVDGSGKTVSIDNAIRTFFVNAGNSEISNEKTLNLSKNSTGFVNVQKST